MRAGGAGEVSGAADSGGSGTSAIRHVRSTCVRLESTTLFRNDIRRQVSFVAVAGESSSGDREHPLGTPLTRGRLHGAADRMGSPLGAGKPAVTVAIWVRGAWMWAASGSSCGQARLLESFPGHLPDAAVSLRHRFSSSCRRSACSDCRQRRADQAVHVHLRVAVPHHRGDHRPFECTFWIVTGVIALAWRSVVIPRLTRRGRRRPAIYLACPAAVRRRLAMIASHSDSNKMTIPSRACSPPIHLLFSPAAASAV